MSILKKLLGNSKTEISKQENTKVHNFDLLVENARSSGTIEDLNLLYLEFFELNEWNYIVSNNCKIEDAKPFIGIVDELPWLFVFTDILKADYYARKFGNFLESDGNTLVLTMSQNNSLRIIQQLHERGVYGVRINEGENGWFTDIPGLFNIKSYLSK